MVERKVAGKKERPYPGNISLVVIAVRLIDGALALELAG